MRILSTLLIALSVLCSCSAGAQSKEANNNDKKMKSIVIYFSHAGENYSVGVIEQGNTKLMAYYICDKTGAERFEIVAEKSYDMPYKELTELAKKEQQTGELPAFKGAIENFDQYDTIFLGSPNWWGTYPQVVFSFLSKYNLDGKTVYPFVTHEGSSFGSQLKDLKKLFPNANIKDGLSVAGHDVRSEGKERAEKWLKKMGF